MALSLDFRSQFDQMMDTVKKNVYSVICKEIDAQATGLYSLFARELSDQLKKLHQNNISLAGQNQNPFANPLVTSNLNQNSIYQPVNSQNPMINSHQQALTSTFDQNNVSLMQPQFASTSTNSDHRQQFPCSTNSWIPNPDAQQNLQSSATSEIQVKIEPDQNLENLEECEEYLDSDNDCSCSDCIIKDEPIDNEEDEVQLLDAGPKRARVEHEASTSQQSNPGTSDPQGSEPEPVIHQNHRSLRKTTLRTTLYKVLSLSCPLCPLELPDQPQLQQHLIADHGTNLWPCGLPECSESFPER